MRGKGSSVGMQADFAQACRLLSSLMLLLKSRIRVLMTSSVRSLSCGAQSFARSLTERVGGRWPPFV